MAKQARPPPRAGHKLDSFLLNAPLVPWAMRKRPHLAPGRSPASLGSDHGPMVLSISLAVAAKERITAAMGIVTQWAMRLQTSDFYGPSPPTPNTQAPHDRPPPQYHTSGQVENGKIWNRGKRSTWGKA